MPEKKTKEKIFVVIFFINIQMVLKKKNVIYLRKSDNIKKRKLKKRTKK